MLLRGWAAAAGSAGLIALLVASCGGAPAAKPPELPAPGAGEPAAKPGPAAAAQTPAAPEKTAADHHRDFMTGCSKKAINSPDYCECAWGEFRKVFTDEEMSSGDMPAAKLERVKSQVAGACSSKVSEETVRDGFSKGCVGEPPNARPEMKPYCDCTWTEFRKRFSPAELGDEGTVQSERFIAARPPVIKACGAKLPEGVAKDDFMKGCAKDPKTNAFCTCAWKELRKQVSAAEIEAGAFDQKTVFAQVEKSCGKLRPK